MGGLITLAWITLWVWEQSPYGRYLNHQELADLDLGSLNVLREIRCALEASDIERRIAELEAK